MEKLKLKVCKGVFCVLVDDDWWILDTGAPLSFGNRSSIVIADKEFDIPFDYMGITAKSISDQLGFEIDGLLGGDLFKELDWSADIDRGIIEFSTGLLLRMDGEEINIKRDVAGVPVVSVVVGGESIDMIWDTGAKVSYLEGDLLSRFPSRGIIKDFYPFMGYFDVETYLVDVKLGSIGLKLQCGALPEFLENALILSGARGILGNEIFNGKIVAYSFRRRKISLEWNVSTVLEQYITV